MAIALTMDGLPAVTTAGSSRIAVDVGALFDAHAEELLRYVHRLTGRREAAEEIVQEVFITAHRRRSELVAGTNLRAWLYQVATHHVRHHRRGLSRWFGLLDRFQARVGSEPIGGPEEAAARKSDGRRIATCLQDLPPEQREVFVLFELQELGGPDIANTLGVSVNTVWSRLRLARARFRTAWDRGMP